MLEGEWVEASDSKRNPLWSFRFDVECVVVSLARTVRFDVELQSQLENMQGALDCF